ncbi:hypothetical protein NGRA_0089 [Nosema granulosis]|uniref:Uncharacterized protein n=1 Tax=Nosema granulosis TaxID=83296 RepID=A0A9P6H129_9MICR|nr:hypothetical protein NGRA_0089 [Nosema granulosis]
MLEKLRSVREKIQKEAKKLKFNRNKEYYRKMGFNEYLEKEEKVEIMAVVPKDYKSQLESEEIRSYVDTTSKLIRIRGYPFYIEEILRKAEECVVEVPMAFYNAVKSKANKLGENIEIKKEERGKQSPNFKVTIPQGSEDFKRYIFEILENSLNDKYFN